MNKVRDLQLRPGALSRNTHAAGTAPDKRAVGFFSPAMTKFEEAVSQPRMIVEDAYLRAKGYKVDRRIGDKNELLKLLFDSKFQAISYRAIDCIASAA